MIVRNIHQARMDGRLLVKAHLIHPPESSDSQSAQIRPIVIVPASALAFTDPMTLQTRKCAQEMCTKSAQKTPNFDLFHRLLLSFADFQVSFHHCSVHPQADFLSNC